MKNLLFLLVIPISICSCSTVQKTATIKTQRIQANEITHIPVVADLEVSETKVIGIAEGKSSELTSTKLMAIKDALNKADADILVEPIFESENNGLTVKVKVTGWPASYKNFRSITNDDIALIQAGKGVNTNDRLISNQNGNSKKIGQALGITTGAALILSLILLMQ